MHAIELPSEYHITTKKDRDLFCRPGYYFNKLGNAKPVRTVHNKVIATDVFIMGAFQRDMNLAVIVTGGALRTQLKYP